MNAMGGSSSRSVLFRKQKKHKPSVSRLRGALHIKKPKKKKNYSLLMLHSWRLKKPKREGSFKGWLSLAVKRKKKTNRSFGSSRSRKESVFKSLPTRQKGRMTKGGGKKGSFRSNKASSRPF